MTRAWETLDSELVLDGAPWLRVWRDRVRLPSGRELAPFYTYRKNDFSSIFAQDAQGRVLVERRYRHGPRRVTLDIPAGYVEPSEDPLAAAKRELREETGYEAARWRPLGTFQTDGNSGGSLCHIFLAQDARKVAEPVEDDTEEAEHLLMTLAEVRDALRSDGFATLAAGATASRALVELASAPSMSGPDRT